MGEKARAGDGVIGGRRAGRAGRPVLRLRPGLEFRRGFAGRGPRRHDRQSAGARRAGPRAGRRFRLLGRRSPPGGGGGARRLRPDLPPDRRPLRSRPPCLGDHRSLGGRGAYSPALTDWVVMTRGGQHVPHRPGVGARGARRGGSRRPSSAAPACHERNGVLPLRDPRPSPMPRCCPCDLLGLSCRATATSRCHWPRHAGAGRRGSPASFCAYSTVRSTTSAIVIRGIADERRAATRSSAAGA